MQDANGNFSIWRGMESIPTFDFKYLTSDEKKSYMYINAYLSSIPNFFGEYFYSLFI